MPRLAANLSMMFNEVPFLERFTAARKAGFEGVEFLFPYEFAAAELRSRMVGEGLTQRPARADGYPKVAQPHSGLQKRARPPRRAILRRAARASGARSPQPFLREPDRSRYRRLSHPAR